MSMFVSDFALSTSLLDYFKVKRQKLLKHKTPSRV